MNTFIQKIEDIILENNNVINKNIIGINYLEKIKYLIIDNLKNIDKLVLENLITDLKNSNDQSIKYKFKDNLLFSSICLYKDSLSRIKLSCNHDILSIMINGYKTVAIFDLDNNNKSTLLSIPKNMGLVLSENTVTSEVIASGSVILDIFYENKVSKIEN